MGRTTTCREWTVVILILLSAQVFLTTCVKNPFLLEYFDAVRIVSKIDEYSSTLLSSSPEENSVSSASPVGSHSSRPNNDGAAAAASAAFTKMVQQRTEESTEARKKKKKKDEVSSGAASFPGNRDSNHHKPKATRPTKPKKKHQRTRNPARQAARQSKNKNWGTTTTTTKLTEGTTEVHKKPNDSEKKKNVGGKPKNPEQQQQQRQRIVILAGPHKTASTTLQGFFSDLAAQTIRLENGDTTSVNTEHGYTPHPTNPDWVFPVGALEESIYLFREIANMGKFYAPLASYITSRRWKQFFPRMKDKSEDFQAYHKRRIRDYYRHLMRVPWEEGKNLVIAAEAFDGISQRLVLHQDGEQREGEAVHIADDSGYIIDALLDIFPWNDGGEETQPQKLELTDFEVQLNLRTPRSGHLVSIWHQLGRNKDLRDFLSSDGLYNLYQINTLGLALQFCHWGIPTTIIDMAGVGRDEPSDEEENNGTTLVVGGLRGVVGCEILGMDHLCDRNSRMHLPGYELPVEDQNVKPDKKERSLTDEQLDEIGEVLDAYDCGVWQHLKRYRDQGLLRLLHPSEHLFESCGNNNNKKHRDIPFAEVLDRIKEIALRDNGIPRKPRYGRQGKLKSNQAELETKMKHMGRDFRERMDWVKNSPVDRSYIHHAER